MPKLGCHRRLTSIIQQFHNDMKGQLIMGNELFDSFFLHNDVKQGCVLAPTLLRLFFASLVKVAFKSTMAEIWVETRTDGKLLNLTSFKTRTKLREILVRELQFADDCALIAYSLKELKEITIYFTFAA